MKPVRLCSLEVQQTWGARGEASVVRARATEHALEHDTPKETYDMPKETYFMDKETFHSIQLDAQ